MSVGQVRHAQVPIAPSRLPELVRWQACSRKLPERLTMDFRTAPRRGVELGTPCDCAHIDCRAQLPAGNEVRTKPDWIRVTHS